MLLTCPAKLILGPTDHLVGGTEIARVECIHLAGLSHDFELTGEPKYGSSPSKVAITGWNLAYSVKLADVDAAGLALLTNKTASGLNWAGNGSYKLGHDLDDDNLNRVLLRPVKPDGTLAATKPFLWIPRAFCATALNLTWDRHVEHGAALNALIIGLVSEYLNAPALIGDPTTWPEHWATDGEEEGGGES